MDSLKELLEGQGIRTDSLAPWKDGYSLVIPCQDGVATWLKLRDLVPRTDFWPVLREVKNLDRGEDIDQAADPIIRRGEAIDPAEWFPNQHRLNMGERAAASEAADPWTDGITVLEGFPRGPWPGEGDQDEDEDEEPPALSSQLTRSWSWIRTEVALVLVPTRICWHVPAFLGFGGWNACPSPDEQVAIWKYWNHRHDAEVMTVTHEIVEMRVGRPPGTRDQAIALAKEQYIYCSDIVNQGTDTIDRLAAGLLGSPAWSFWWD